jgi:hypothetical protein
MTVLASVDVEVTAKLNPMEQALAGARQEVQSFEKEATASVNKVADQVNRANSVVGKSADAAAAAEKALAKGLSETSEEAKKLGLTQAGLEMRQARLAKEAEKAAAALAKEAKEAKNLQAAAQPAATAVDKLAGANDNLADAAGEMAEGFDLADKNINKMAGSLGRAVGQIATGGSPTAALGSAARSAGGALLGMGAGAVVAAGAVALAAGAVIAGGIAWNQYEEAAAKAELALYGAGRAAGMTASDFERTAQAAADMANISINAAREQTAVFVQSGLANSAIIDDLIAVTKDYAAVTGQEATAAANELAAAFNGDADAIAVVFDKLGGLDQKTREHIESLLRQNDLVGAQNALLKALQGEVRGAADEVTGLAAAWRNVSIWAANAFAAMGKFISLESGGGTTDERLDRARSRREAPLGRAGAFIQRQLGGESAFDTEIRQLEITQRQERADAAAGAARAERNRIEREGAAATAALLPGDRQRATISGQIADIERAVAAGTMSRVTADRALVAARRQLAAIDKREAGPQARRSRGNNREEQLRREAEAMEVNASSAITLARAYLESGDAALKAEADRQALTQATRRGIDVDEQARRQLAINIANIAVAGAKAASSAQEEADARRVANDSVLAGAQSYREAAEWAQIDAAQRPLQNALLLAEGEAREAIADAINAQYDAITALNRENARSQIIQQTESLRDQNEVLALEVSLIGKGNAERRTALAQLQAMQRLRALGIDPESPEGIGFLGEVGKSTQLQTQQELARFTDQATESTLRQIKAFEDQGRTIGMTFIEAERFRKEQDLLNQAAQAGIDLGPEQRAAIAQLADAYALASDKLRQLEEHQRALQDATRFATDEFSNFFDEIIFGSGSAEDALRSLLKSVGQAMLRGFLSGDGPLAGILGSQGQNGQQGGALGSMFGNIFGGLFKARVAHSGMSPYGEPASSRMVSPAVFHNAPRLHSGLKPDEFPAILQRGEGVTPKGHRGGAGGAVVYMTVNTPDADSFRRSDRQIGRQLKRRLSV